MQWLLLQEAGIDDMVDDPAAGGREADAGRGATNRADLGES